MLAPGCFAAMLSHGLRSTVRSPGRNCYKHQAMQKPLRGWLDASKLLCFLTDFAAQCEVLGGTVTNIRSDFAFVLDNTQINRLYCNI